MPEASSRQASTESVAPKRRLIIQGDKDSIVPYESSLYVHNNIKSEVNILAKMKGVTHDVFNGSRGEDAISLIEEFLRKRHLKKGKFKIEI